MVFLWFSVPFDQRKILHDLQQRLLIRKVQGLGELVVEVPRGTLGIFPTDFTRKKWDLSGQIMGKPWENHGKIGFEQL